jgi:CheY-like chemotaxis protein
VIQLLGGRSTAPVEEVVVGAPQRRPLERIAGARVLLVEDNELNRDVATELLADAGLVVDVARNGQEALAMLRESSYDAVLMDMQMPVMDGLEATREIRRMPGLGALPVIAMTANAMASDRERCLEAGMNDHVAKPIDPKQLWETLLAWIKPRLPQPLPGLRAARVPDQPLPPALAEVPGLDVRTALDRLLGKTAVYVGLLRRFVVSQAAADARIAASISGGDFGEAHRLVHTLKGLAATIGAASLRDVAARLETAIETRQPTLALETLRVETSLRLQALLAPLTAALPPEDVLVLPEIVDTRVLLAACASLQDALEAGSFEAQAVLVRNQALFSQAFGPLMPPLLQSVGDFDFEGALAALRQAMAARAGAGL